MSNLRRGQHAYFNLDADRNACKFVRNCPTFLSDFNRNCYVFSVKTKNYHWISFTPR